MSAAIILHPKNPPKPTPEKPRKKPDYTGKIGVSVNTHEELQEILARKGSVFMFGKPLPVQVAMNQQYGLICHWLKMGSIKYYHKDGGQQQ